MRFACECEVGVRCGCGVRVCEVRVCGCEVSKVREGGEVCEVSGAV